jgi:hypothetical protein
MATAPRHAQSQVSTPEHVAQMQLEQLKQISAGIGAITLALQHLRMSLDQISAKLGKG